MRRLLALLLLAGCSSDSTPSVDSPDAASAEAPAGSAGAYTLRFAESDAEDAPASEVSGALPAPIPADAFPLTTLTEAPSYHIGVDRATVPEGFDFDGTYFLFLQQNETRKQVKLLRGAVGLSNNFRESYSGSVATLTFPPIWPADGPTPTMTLDRMGDAEGQVASFPLAVSSSRPAWLQPIEVPTEAFAEDGAVTAELELDPETHAAYLLYREDGNRWELEDFRVSRVEAQLREREGDPRSTTPYVVYPDAMDATTPEAYLIVFPL